MSNLQQRARRMIWRRHIPGFKSWNRLFYRREHPSLGREAFGIRFPHPLGVAPVLERQYDLLDELDSIGFAFTGIIPGTTPIPVIADRLASRKSGIIASVELKAEESDENQVQDHLVRTYSLLYDFADYFIIDINRQSGLSSLDDLSDWTEILDELLSLRLCYERYKPILLRLSPSHSDEQMGRILDFSLLSGIDGLVAPGISKVRQVVTYTKGRIPVIGSGAITAPEDAIALLDAGATLIEVAQGIPSKGYSTSKRILKAIEKSKQKA